MNNNARVAMASGEWFDAADIGLGEDRAYAQKTMMRFNTDITLDDEGRMTLLRSLFGRIGEGSTVMVSAHVDYGFNISMGQRCFFNYNCVFLDGAEISFGNDVWAGPGCYFATPVHPLLGKERALRMGDKGVAHLWERNEPIVVGNDVWFAAGVIVNPGVNIGDGAVIGSGSVVTKDIPPYTLCFGNPCRVIREITEQDSVKELEKFLE